MKKLTVLILPVLLSIFSQPVFAQTNSIIDSLENVLKTAKEDSNKVLLLIEISKKYSKLNVEKQSIYAEEAITLSKKITFKKGNALALKAAAEADRDRANNKAAIEKLIAAKKIFEEIDDKKGMALITGALAQNYRVLNNYKAALESATQALKLLIELDNKKGIATTYHVIGLINYDQSNYPEALENYLLSKKMFEEIGDLSGIGAESNNIADVNHQMGQFDIALTYYKEAKKNFELSGNKAGLGHAIQGMGQVCALKKEYDDALNYYNQALILYKEIGSKRDICALYFCIGEAYYYQSDFVNALNYFEMLKNLGIEINSKTYISEAYYMFGFVYSKMGNYGKAIDNFKKALEAHEGKRNYVGYSIIYQGISEAYEALDSTKKSLEYFKLYLAAKDSVYNAEKSKQITELQTKYETEKKDNEITLLNKENDLKALRVKQQQASLLAANLEAERKKSEIELLNQSKEIQELELKKQKEELEKKQLESRIKESELKLVDNEKKLQVAEVGRQKLLKNSQLVIFLLLVISGILGFFRFRQMQFQRQEQERIRIARDLHDDVGATLGSISIYSAVAKNKSSGNGEMNEVLEKIGDSSREMLEKMNDIVWAVNPKNDNAEELVHRMKNFAAVMLTPRQINFSFDADAITDDKLKLGMQQRKNIFLIYKEALHNIIKYAEAKEVKVKVKVNGKDLFVEVHDDGKGFNPENTSAYNGNGIKNMKERAVEIGGKLEVNSLLNKGTQINLNIPV